VLGCPVLRRRLAKYRKALRGGLDGDATQLRWWPLNPPGPSSPAIYTVKVRGTSDSGAWLAETIDRLSGVDFWTDDALWATIYASLPNYRLTKFQPLMPD